MNEPNIQVYDVDIRGSRAMTLRHFQHNRQPLAGDTAQEVLRHLHGLWKFDISLESVNAENEIKETWNCPLKGDKEEKK